MNKSISRNIMVAIAAICLLPQAAMAHTVMGSTSGFIHGLSHPFTGLDHMLAMIAVGLWAAQMGGRKLWLVPAAFVSAMVLGGAIGFAGVSLPYVEVGIVASVIVLGVFISGAFKLTMAISTVVVGAFAVFHGYAHGAEMSHGLGPVAYSIGFVLATAALHMIGMLAGMGIQHRNVDKAVRLAGAAIALSGVYLAMS
jgi:urease accessory protein